MNTTRSKFLLRLALALSLAAVNISAPYARTEADCQDCGWCWNEAAQANYPCCQRKETGSQQCSESETQCSETGGPCGI